MCDIRSLCNTNPLPVLLSGVPLLFSVSAASRLFFDEVELTPQLASPRAGEPERTGLSLWRRPIADLLARGSPLHAAAAGTGSEARGRVGSVASTGTVRGARWAEMPATQIAQTPACFVATTASAALCPHSSIMQV